MKIVLFGLFGCGNLGNDGSLESVARRLETLVPGVELTATCFDADEVSKRLDIATVPIGRSHYLSPLLRKLDRLLLKLPSKATDFARAFRTMWGADAMIIPGTGILDDFGERPLGMPLTIFVWTLAARLAGAEVAFVSIGAGPIRKGLSRVFMLQAARLAQYRSYRDINSKEFMTRSGIDTSGDALFPDVAFGLAEPEPAADRGARADGALTVGIGVMNYGGWYHYAPEGRAIYDSYIASLTEFAAWLLDQGYDIRLVTGEMNDQVAVDDIVRGLAEIRPREVRGRVAAEPSHSLADVMYQLSMTDVAVVSRFHNVVCAIKMAVPVMSLGYAAKNEALLEQVGLGGMSQHMEGFDIEVLKSGFADLVANRADVSETLRARASQFREQLREQDALVMRQLGIPHEPVYRAEENRKGETLPSGRGG